MTRRHIVMACALLAGCGLGLLGGPVWVLLPWALTGFILGWCSDSARLSLINGTVFGFAVSYVFMLASYDGTAAISTKLLPFIIFGVIGAICGLALARFGYLFSRH